MNERVMQFRIGMFVIVAGLVLTMLIVWFGESPSLLRDQTYIKVHYIEAPGVSEGIPVRKSGIRVGEVTAVAFDERAGQPDGVLVTISLDRKFKLKAGSTPRITRALIGDVSIDLMPGTGPGLLKGGDHPSRAPIIEGAVAPDPANALAAATATLESIQLAANGIAAVTKKAENVDEVLDSLSGAGKKVGDAAESIDRFIRTNEAEFQPALAHFRQVAEKANSTFDAQTQDQLKTAIDRIAKASARLDAGLADLQPLIRDLGAAAGANPTTNFGWALLRFNRIMYDVSVLAKVLTDDRGRLNTNGSLQRLLSRPDLYDNMNHMSVAVGQFFTKANVAIGHINTFAEKVARDPSAMTRGALRPQ